MYEPETYEKYEELLEELYKESLKAMDFMYEFLEEIRSIFKDLIDFNNLEARIQEVQEFLAYLLSKNLIILRERGPPNDFV